MPSSGRQLEVTPRPPARPRETCGQNGVRGSAMTGWLREASSASQNRRRAGR